MDGSRLTRRRLLAGVAATGVGAAVAPGLASATPAAGAGVVGSSAPVRTGVQRLMSSGYAEVAGQRVGIITNPTGILPDLRHEVDVMHDDAGIELVAVFGPEHGFRGTAQAGGSEGFYDDPRTGLPVYDTYNKSGQTLAEVFTRSGVDTVLFDIQDIGARFYTYIWTLYDSMVAASMAGKRFLVLDRPNATSGRRALGPVLDPAYATFVGRKPIAQLHGMTVAELALMFNAKWVPADAGQPVDLDVVTMSGWSRDMYFEQTGQAWVPPSPNMPTVDTAVVYSGTCMFEGTNLSEGRGSTRPFEEIGAPFIDWQWRDALTSAGLAGAAFRENYFVPTFSKWVNQTVGGVQLYVTNRQSYDPIRTGIAMLVTAKRLYPDFAWRSDNWIDKLTGSSYVRNAIDAGQDTDQVVAGWQQALENFRALRNKYLIYRG